MQYIVFAFPWLLLCKMIAFDYSSTDNLNELIERPSKYGLGGGGYLYLLLVIVASVSTFIAWSGRIAGKWRITAALSLAVSVPVGWWLLNKGLVTNFTKYKTTYSGVDFLLGPDRKHKLPQYRIIFEVGRFANSCHSDTGVWSVYRLSGTSGGSV